MGPVAACAPNRRSRHSQTLGRRTCLSLKEENALSKDAPAGGSYESKSDREIASQIGVRDVLRPLAPEEWVENPRTWLSNLDIDAAMSQYARTSKKFVYLGTWPTDFAERLRSGGRCVQTCTPEPFVEAQRTRSLAATIINLDVHTGPGTHWVAFALDCRKPNRTPKMMYYDPTGRPPPPRWAKASAWAVIAASAPDEDTRRRMLAEAVYNRVPHQSKNTECGVFSMMCVDALIAGRSFEKHCSLAITDDDAFRSRNAFFELPRREPSEGGASTTRWSWAQIFGGLHQDGADRSRRHRSRIKS